MSQSNHEKENQPMFFVDTPEVKKMGSEALKLTNEIIDLYGPRLSGSESCLKAAKHLHKELNKYCDAAYIEDFILHPGAFMGFIKVCIVCFLIGTVFVAFNCLFLSLCSIAFGVMSLVFEYIFYFHFLDRFYPSKKGTNVHGVIEPDGEVKQNVILSGHHDSVHIFNFYYDNPEMYMIREIRGFLIIIIFFVIMVVLNIWKLKVGVEEFETNIFTTKRRLIFTAFLVVCFFLIKQLWYFLNDKGTPGAGDNLSASCMAVIMSKYFREKKENGKGLKNTRLYFTSFDSEEEGLRGSNKYFIRHKKEFSEVPTYNINIDCTYYHDEVRFMTKDINWTVNLSSDLANICCGIAESQGFHATAEPIRFLCGACDSGEAAKNGIKSTTMLSIPFTNANRATVYHTPDDVVDNIEPRAIEQALAIMITFAEKLDAGEYTIKN